MSAFETQLAHIQARADRLTPDMFMARIDVLVRGGHSATSIPQGSRAAEKPGPQLDAVDVALLAARDGYRKAFDLVAGELRKLEAWERSVLCTMGVEVDHEAFRAGEKEARKAMAEARSKASQLLVDEEQGIHKFVCYGCADVVRVTKDGERSRGGRCRACDDWWRANGKPDTNREAGTGKTPQHIIDARIVRRSRKQVG